MNEFIQMTTGQRFSPEEMIRKLVSFDTTSRNSNLELIHWIAGYLASWGVESDIIRDESGAKANLYATIGPKDRGGVVLSGHTDVVPVDGQDWHTDPWTVVERDGRLFGRGTADMKSFIACALALVPDFLERPLKTPVHFAFSYDEEVGCLGVYGIVDFIKKRGILPRIVIIGEPTGMKVVNAHKTCCSADTTVRGLEGHGSATHVGVNAIAYAAELIGELDRMAREFRKAGDQTGRFDPPYSTINVGTIQGGTARNIIPLECSFKWDARLLPGIDPDEIFARFDAFAQTEVLPRMRAVSDKVEIVTRRQNTVPGLRPEEGSPAETLVLALAESNETFAVSYATEGGIFQEAGVPTVVCGPGDILQAHAPDEYIEQEQVKACLRFMGRLIDTLRSG